MKSLRLQGIHRLYRVSREKPEVILIMRKQEFLICLLATLAAACGNPSEPPAVSKPDNHTDIGKTEVLARYRLPELGMSRKAFDYLCPGNDPYSPQDRYETYEKETVLVYRDNLIERRDAVCMGTFIFVDRKLVLKHFE